MTAALQVEVTRRDQLRNLITIYELKCSKLFQDNCNVYNHADHTACSLLLSVREIIYVNRTRSIMRAITVVISFSAYGFVVLI